MENKNWIHKGLSRRDFMKKTTMAAGGGLFLGSLPIGASAHAGATSTLNVAVIGCGGRGTGAANQVLNVEGTKIVALHDAFRDRLDGCYNALAQRHADSGRLDVPEERKFVGFDGYEEAIALADVVILTAPPGFRPAHFESAVRQGKHIFAEKPMATDAPGVRSILESARIAKEKDLNVVIGLQRRYQRKYLEVVDRVHNGAMGDIISGQIYWNDGGVWVRERQPDMSEIEYQMRNWYYFTWICGDHILEQHIHNIDIANWFIGEYPESCNGMGGREVRNTKEHGHIFDHHYVEFTYPSGAVIASQCRHIPNTFSRVSERFQGTRGTVDCAPGLIRDYSGIVRYDHDGTDDPNPYQQEIDDLFAAIRNGNRIDDSDFGAKSTLAAIMGRMATYSGQVITWDNAINSDAKLVPDYVGWDMEPPIKPDENGYYPIPVPGVTAPH
ncbi:MAG: twin-arginine translocation signal domain-containing protein [Balneolaceae bacterium]|nr:MAG: twin-arginine translocation signal domain-containing protein [Balneolaceae bacterium]